MVDASRHNRVVIVQPRVPSYRVAMFRHLALLLRRSGLDLLLATPPLDDADRRRSDEAAEEVAVQHLRAGAWSAAGRTLTYRHTLGLVSSARIAVLEQSGSNLDLYANLVRAAARGTPPVAVWGHGYPATSARGPLEERLIGVALRLCDHFFAYTEGGSAYAVKQGVPADRTTVLGNSMDTRSLSHAVEGFAETLSGKARAPNRALFIGALDPSKRLDLLIAASDRVRQRIPDFSLVIGGDGPLREWVAEQCSSRPWIEWVGPMDARSKAEWASRSAVIAMPGRVGLVAVDSFVLGTPIVTTDWPFHSVEFEYLANEADCLVTPDHVEAYASGMCDLLNDRERLRRLSTAAASKAASYSAEAMAQRFAEGLLGTLARGKRQQVSLRRRGSDALRS